MIQRLVESQIPDYKLKVSYDWLLIFKKSDLVRKILFQISVEDKIFHMFTKNLIKKSVHQDENKIFGIKSIYIVKKLQIRAPNIKTPMIGVNY